MTKTKITIPDEVYQDVWDLIETSKEYSGGVTNFYYDGDGWLIRGSAEYEVTYVDDSFSHEFGTEKAFHYEVGATTDITIEECVFFENEGEYNEIQHDVFFNKKHFFSINN